MAISGVKGTATVGTTIGEVKSWSCSCTADTVEAGQVDGWKLFVKGLQSATGNVVFTAGSSIPDIGGACATTISLGMGGTYGCNSGYSTPITISGNAILTNINIEVPQDGVVQYTCDFTFTDTVAIS